MKGNTMKARMEKHLQQMEAAGVVPVANPTTTRSNNMKKRSIAMALLVAAAAIGMVSHAEETKEAPKKQTHCPVMTKNPINKEQFVDVKGYRIYVCCPGCIGKIKADPDKYIKQMQAEGIELEKAPAKEADTNQEKE